MSESNLITYAKSEMERAFKEPDGAQKVVNHDILQLLQTFSNQHHSGMIGAYVLGLFNRLVRFMPITPLTGEEDEWQSLGNLGDFATEQNVRYGSVFRLNKDNSTAFNINGRIFVDEDGRTYTSSESSVPVTFPYTVPEQPEYVRRNMDVHDDSRSSEEAEQPSEGKSGD